MPNDDLLLYETEKSSHRRLSTKTLFYAIFPRKHLCGIFKNTYFEEHLRTAASGLTL